MELNAFIAKLSQQPEQIEFSDTMAVIDQNYTFTPTTFINGNTINEANQNNGSCKIFAFGQLNSLSEQQTLACFGAYYRNDVLNNPDGDDHQNIRNFMVAGWNGIEFNSQALNLT
jgi:type III HopJ-like effector protein